MRLRAIMVVLACLATVAAASTNLVVAITSGASRVTVTNLSLAYVPTNVLCTVSAPDVTNALLIGASPIADLAATNSVTVDLDAITDRAGYQLSVWIYQ